MIAKSSKAPGSKTTERGAGHRKEGPGVDRKMATGMVKKPKTGGALAPKKSSQTLVQQKTLKPKIVLETLDEKSQRIEDTIDLAMSVVNDLITKIQCNGLDFEDSDEEEGVVQEERPLSPCSNTLSTSSIWRSDWSSESMRNLFGCESGYKSNGSNPMCSTHHDSTTKSSNHSTQYQSQSLNRTESFSSLYQPLFPPMLPTPSTYINFQIYYSLIELDRRTTIMVKNIPNKYSLHNLSKEIDETHSQEYNFLYLPFDYSSNCNMGYAFVNFASSGSLKSFYEIYNLRRWKRFKSEKICELSYARIQGLESLEEHFHSSKVLNQKGKNYRPIFKDVEGREGGRKGKQNYFSQTTFPTYR